MMEEARNTFIVYSVPQRTLFIAQGKGSPPHGMPVVAAQSREIERVNQIAKRYISSGLKLFNAVSDDFFPFRNTALVFIFSQQYSGGSQQRTNVSGKRLRYEFS